ncbi:methyltransferase domain-containing protein [Vibrio metschnikovii]|uniref:Protein N-lysine methyltransferase family protein n=7 Tax=Bacteria TaxID=2 RepID=A0AAU6TPZ9_UNCXX|nr:MULTISPECIES: methyltransferase domain-containing protein [Vibrio]EKO3573808.1 methyltransferase domain-containing protein [Vibrio metschnikovii]EKO3643303.1 methyltransferase domain-containing protein [Vibrio metschnikovii]EKO3667600.1 methyltransferase domain-containing protein [Vibrio metschnikovii]EKO3722605.1 methyltransferase domain-containing protein [Vibrio metschnikovii]EKO3726238.1 methyltransferase domain-containing protein [Vibrio metschnikovii]
MTTTLRIRYQTIVIGNNDIHLCTLRDKQQFSDPKNTAQNLGISSASWPIFGVVWPSSLVLAHHVLNLDTNNKRILEVGCGIGLSSLLLNEQMANITATDYHPEVETFLDRNTQLNNRKKIAFERVDWADASSQLGLFDLIIGSDLLYEDQHISLLAQFIQTHANQTCDIIIVDPDRGRKNKLSSKMSEYGFTSDHIRPDNTDYLEQKFKGHILRFSRTSESI